MNVLAYILSRRYRDRRKTRSHHGRTGIIFGGLWSNEGDKEDLLKSISTILRKGKKNATFHNLYLNLPFKWEKYEVYDTVNPFGDMRGTQYRAVWTFDIEMDMLLYKNNRHSRSEVPFALFRERTVTLADLEPTVTCIMPQLEPTDEAEMCYWKPQVRVNERIRSFTHQILRDFNHEWRHILRNRYNSTTLRKLARAIVRLSTLDFEVHEADGGPRGKGDGFISVTQLPEWESFKDDIVSIGNVYVVICQSIKEGLSMAKGHVKFHANITPKTATTTDEVQVRYVLLSVVQIVLCRITGLNSLEHTAPEPLFNGDNRGRAPSELAFDYLLWAMSAARKSVETPIILLPLELQDMILGYASAGSAGAAYMGCLLEMGSFFRPKDGPPGTELEDTSTSKSSLSLAESRIWFDKYESGLVYRG